MKRVLGSLITAAALIVLVPAAASAELRVGINAGPYLDEQTLNSIASAKLDVVRVPFFWRDVQPTDPLTFDWTSTDSQVLAAARTGVYLDVVLAGAPPWALASVPPERLGSVDTIPPNHADFAAFAEAIVRRYGREGSLWTDYPELEIRPIRSWQIWNEPNLVAFSGQDSSSPLAYASLFNAASEAIERAEPTAAIWVAGVARGGRSDHDPLPYMTTLWRSFGRAKAVRYKWAVHVYTTSASNVLAAITQIASAMARRDARQRDCVGCRLVLGEFGWSSSAKSPRCFKCVGNETAQSAIAASTLGLLRGKHVANRLDGALWYSWRDSLTGPFQNRMGATRETGFRKPVLATLTRFAALP